MVWLNNVYYMLPNELMVDVLWCHVALDTEQINL